jgi:DNA-directed RNA polymerase beta' subunit
MQIKKLSVKKIVSPVTVDPFGNSLPDGLYDAALGPHGSEQGTCVTCKLQASICPGHFGHVELPVPVYNPLLLRCGFLPVCPLHSVRLCSTQACNNGMFEGTCLDV